MRLAATLMTVGMSMALLLVPPVAVSPALAQAPAMEGDKITMNVQDADIRVLIQWMSRQLNRSIIIDPRVKGNVTVHAGEPMSPDEAYQVFLSVLQVHGYAAVESGSAIKVIPDVNAKQIEVPVVDRSGKFRGDSMVVRVIKVKNVSAVQLVALLRPLIPQVGHLAAYPSTNVLVISDRAANIERIVSIISQIDKAGEIDVELVPLKNADASEVIDVLNSMLPKTPGVPDGGSQVSFAADTRSNSILMGGDPLVRQQVRSLIKQLDAPLAREGNTQVIYLHYARAEDMVPILQSITGSIQKEGGDQAVAKGNISIEASENTNAVVITAPPSVQRTLHKVIRQLDIRRAQVLVEAVIVEVNDSTLEALGVEWNTNVSTTDGALAGSRIGTTSQTTINSEFDTFAGTTGPGLGAGFSLGYFRGGSLRTLIRAINNDTSNNILSTPSIVTLDNEEAEILVGQNVPFVTGSSTQTGAGVTNPFQTIERNDVGVTLKIRPHINQGDAITLEVEQEVSSVTQSAVVTSDVVTNKRSIKTRVLIEDDQILVLGGLISDDASETVNKVPFLGDMPIVGHLFRNTQVTNDKVNLMVFIHPVILKDQAQGNKVTSERYGVLRKEQAEFNDGLVDFFAIDEPPLLPEFREFVPGHAGGEPAP